VRDPRPRLFLAGFLAHCSYSICRTPLLPLLARDLGAGAPMLGLIVGASTITGVLLKLPAGAWSDVFGRRPFLIAAGLVFALMPLTYLGVASVGVLIAVRVVHGSATAILGPVIAAGLSQIAPPDRRATWLSGFATVQGLGQVTAPLIAGSVIAGASYDAAFLAAAAIALAVPLMLAGWRDPAPPVRVDRWRQFRSGLRTVMRDRVIVGTSAAQAVQLAAGGAMTAFLPIYAVEALGLGVVQTGALFATHSAAALLVRPLAGQISDRVGRRPIIVAGLGISGLALAMIPFAGGGASLTAIVIAGASGVAMTSASTSALITDRSRQAQYGTAHGVFGTIYDVGDALGPIGSGLLAGAIGFPRMFIVVGAGALLAAALHLRAARTAPR
jgi:DHA1 family multidrug resistance protein-like MFS transporter